jgi:D-ribose pyranase
MGHGDSMTIADAGLPVPNSIELIDIAMAKNIPRFLDVLKVVLSELNVEEAVVAKEMEAVNLEICKEVTRFLSGVKVSKMSHEEFKELTARTKVVIRTGEFTPYSNVILVSGAFPE